MVHLRIVAPEGCAEHALELLTTSPSVLNVIHLPGAARKPVGDVILCDVAREDASVILNDLRELNIPEEGSIAMEVIDSQISGAAVAAEKAAAGLPSDAVVWEEVESRTSENTELSVSFLAFMVIATLIASVGILLDSPILVIGAMVVGPEFGPLAGLCVALVELRGDLARRSSAALAAGFPVAILLTLGMTLVLRRTGVAAPEFAAASNPLTGFIARPDIFSFIVAYLAGTAGVLSLTTAKSAALIGVVISVTTIPSAAYVAVAGAYQDWADAGGALLQLTINVAAIILAGVVTLYVQRRFYINRRRKHRGDPARRAAGLPVEPRSGRGRRTASRDEREQESGDAIVP